LPDPVCSNDSKDLRGKARDIAAHAVGVSGRTVQKAVTLKNADPETFEKVRRGEITMEKASNAADPIGLHHTQPFFAAQKRLQVISDRAITVTY